MRPLPQNQFLTISVPFAASIQNRLNNLSREENLSVVEIIDLQGQRTRQHNPLACKDIKQLKEAVRAYGTHAPFTVALMEFCGTQSYTE